MRLPANAVVAGFACSTSETRYQPKGKNGRYADVIPGAAYKPMIESIRRKELPELVLVEFDQRYELIVFAHAIRETAIIEERVVARTPLKPTARRAGWTGCVIRIDGLPKVSLIEHVGIDPSLVRTEWSRF